MNRRALFALPLLAVAAALLASCASDKKPVARYDQQGNFINPFPPGTYEHFVADPKYPKTYDVWKNQEALAATDASNSRIVICLKKQRGLLMRGDEVVIDYPICSGRKSHPTPPGDYTILEKVVDKRSNKYGKVLDAAGDVVNSDADSTTDPIPEGGSFLGASMRYWMRLTNDGVGHHIGPVRRVPSSHACIRGPSGVMPTVYGKVKLGTPVSVVPDATELHAPVLLRMAEVNGQPPARSS
jgi:hypothetical protein